MTKREKRLERALLVIEGLTLEYADLEDKLAGDVYTIAHGALNMGACKNMCCHVINHENIIEDYISGLKSANILDVKKIQGA